MIEAHVIQKGDTLTPFGGVLMQGGKPVDLASLTLKAFGKNDDGTEWFAERTTGVTAHPTNTFTTNTLDAFDKIRHNGTKARDGMEIVFSSTTTLPAGLVAATRYYVREAEPNGFKVSESPNGPALNITDAGTGTHSYYIVGSFQVDWQTADVDTAGDFWLWLRAYSGTEPDTFPVVHDAKEKNRGLRIKIVDAA